MVFRTVDLTKNTIIEIKTSKNLKNNENNNGNKI